MKTFLILQLLSVTVPPGPRPTPTEAIAVFTHAFGTASPDAAPPLSVGGLPAGLLALARSIESPRRVPGPDGPFEWPAPVQDWRYSAHRIGGSRPWWPVVVPLPRNGVEYALPPGVYYARPGIEYALPPGVHDARPGVQYATPPAHARGSRPAGSTRR